MEDRIRGSNGSVLVLDAEDGAEVGTVLRLSHSMARDGELLIGSFYLMRNQRGERDVAVDSFLLCSCQVNGNHLVRM